LLVVVLKQFQVGAFALRKMYSVPRFDYRLYIHCAPKFFNLWQPKTF